MLSAIILRIITFLHLLFVLFVVFTPFMSSNYFLLLHAVFVPFMMLHWLCNDNTCALTIIERKLRERLYGTKIDDNECFTCRLIEPVYDFKNNYATFSKIIYGLTLGIWSLSLFKLGWRYKHGRIRNWIDLFTI